MNCLWHSVHLVYDWACVCCFGVGRSEGSQCDNCLWPGTSQKEGKSPQDQEQPRTPDFIAAVSIAWDVLVSVSAVCEKEVEPKQKKTFLFTNNILECGEKSKFLHSNKPLISQATRQNPYPNEKQTNKRCRGLISSAAFGAQDEIRGASMEQQQEYAKAARKAVHNNNQRIRYLGIKSKSMYTEIYDALIKEIEKNRDNWKQSGFID